MKFDGPPKQYLMTTQNNTSGLLSWNVKGTIATLLILALSISISPVACLLILWWRRATGLPFAEIGFRKPGNWVYTFGGGIILGICLKILVKSTVMRLFEMDPTNSAFHFIYQDTSKWILYSLLAIPFAGFGEEMVWRGFLFQRLRGPMGDDTLARVAIVFSTSLVFGGLHYLNQGFAGAVNGIIAGALFGSLYFISKKNLWLVIACHSAWDIFSFTMIYYGWERSIATLFF